MRWSGQHSRNVPCKKGEASDVNVYKWEEIMYRMNVYCMSDRLGGGMFSHRQAEEPAAWTAVMLDHM